ncbi:hypothetical protein Fmac_007885 [Flemingia macrophylla]|uniref:Uncharacterized protein n=1 Tax=Flemingia macrophylla TaxID=520843 RepID=A0ABD1MVU2_9FABA
MASLILRPSSKDKDIVGRFNPHGRCKKHPKHRQSPGVCSLCLRDKLSQLSTPSSSSRKVTSLSSSSSSLSSYDSSSASSCASPTTLPFPLDPTKSTASSNSLSIFFLRPNHGAALKSKSMSVVATRRRKTSEADDHVGKKSAKKSGFWSKLLHPKKRSMEEKITKGTSTKQLVHTRSLIQTVT